MASPVSSAPARGARREGLVHGIVVTAVFLIMARGLGLGRELVVSAAFGPSDATDAVYASLTFITTIITIFAMSLPTATAQALYDGTRSDSRRQDVWALVAYFALIAGSLSVLSVFFADPIASLIAEQRTVQFHGQVVAAIRIAAIALFLQCVLIPLTAVTNAEGWHTQAAVVAAGFPLGTFLGVVLLRRHLGPNSLLVGAAAVSVFQVGYLARVISKNGIAPGKLSAREARVVAKLVTKRVLPLLAGVSVLKLDMPILTRLASGQRPGDVFILALSGMLVNVPMSVTNVAIGAPSVPELVRASSNRPAFERLVERTSELGLVLSMPIATLFVTDARGLVEFLFKRGHFSGADATQAALLVTIWGGSSWFLVQALYFEDTLSAGGHARFVALLRTCLLPILVGAIYAGSRRGGLSGLIVGYVLANALRYLILTEALSRIKHVRRSTVWVPTAKLIGVMGLAYLAATMARAGLRDSMVLVRLIVEAFTIAVTVIIVGLAFRVRTITEAKSALLDRLFARN